MRRDERHSSGLPHMHPRGDEIRGPPSLGGSPCMPLMVLIVILHGPILCLDGYLTPSCSASLYLQAPDGPHRLNWVTSPIMDNGMMCGNWDE